MTRRHWGILILLMIAEIISAFESSMILAGLSAWQRITGDPVMVGWIVSSYLLVASAGAALFGRLGDIFGRKQVLLLVILIAAVGSTISALAPNFTILVAGRAIQGAAGAVMPLCYGLVREHLPAERMPFGVSLIVATAASAAAIGLLIGGYLTDHYGPQSIFVASAVSAFAIAAVIAAFLPNSPTSAFPANFDWLGGILFAPGVGALLYALSTLRDGWSALIPLIASIILLGWWWRHERRHPAPLIDVKLLANRNCLLANLGMLMGALGVMQLTQVTSLLTQQPVETGTGLGASATFLGAVKLPALAFGIIGSLGAGWLIPRYGQRVPIVAGALGIIFPTLVIAFAQTSLAVILTTIYVTSMGINLFYAASPTVVIAASPPDRTSEATGLMAVFRATGQALGAQIIAVLLAASLVKLPDGRIYSAATSYTYAFLFMSATGVALLLTALGLRRISHAAPAQAPPIAAPGV
jgi:MFS family permease